jgi:hypothetical protein
MKKIWLTVNFLIFSIILFAQVDTAKTGADDDMNIFLLVFAVVVIATIFGAAIVGAFAAILFFLFAALFISAGVLSVSTMVGFYKRSLQAAFKTFLFIACSLIGMVIGGVGFFMVARLFKLEVSDSTSLIASVLSGLIGGLLMAWIVARVIKLIAGYFARKLRTEE